MSTKKEGFWWWVAILTRNPNYIHYLGAFNSYSEAETYKNIYIQDLKEGKVEIVNIQIKNYQFKESSISMKAMST